VVVPAPGVLADAALAADIQAWVRTRLAAHAYPREVRFAATLPMTATGKVMRRDLRRALAERKT
jgi:acetyl-CoA synthetase